MACRVSGICGVILQHFQWHVKQSACPEPYLMQKKNDKVGKLPKKFACERPIC